MTNFLGKYGLGLVLLLAAVLHAWGLGESLPYSYYGDEQHFVKRALSFGSGDLNPHWFHKPAFYMYVLFGEFGALFVAGKLVGAWDSVSGFAVEFVRNPKAFYLLGRISTSIFGVAAVWLVYLIGKRHFGKAVGLVGALFASLTYGSVDSAQSVKADAPAMFFAVASMLFLLNYLDSRRARDLVLATLAAGVGTATKYYPAIMLLPIVLGACMVHWEAGGDAKTVVKRIALAGLVVAAVFWGAFFVCSPYSVLDPLGRKQTFGRITRLINKVNPLAIVAAEPQRETERATQPEVSTLDGLADYGRVLVSRPGVGPVLGTLALVGIGYGIWPGGRKTRFVLLYALPFVAASVLMHPGYAGPRHQVPIYPFLALCAAVAVVGLLHRFPRFRPAGYVLVFVGLLQPTLALARHGIRVSRPDTRNVAKSWIEANIPAGTRILIDETGPPLLQSPARLKGMLAGFRAQSDPAGQFTTHYGSYLRYQLEAAKGETVYELHELRKAWWREEEGEGGARTAGSDRDRDMGNPLKKVGVETYQFYVDRGFEYAVVHSRAYYPFLTNPSTAASRPAYYAFYKALFERGELVREFTPEGGDYSGPTVKIVRFR